jgi:peptidyl-prolyl cis-trans isomerase SDCCAG10
MVLGWMDFQVPDVAGQVTMFSQMESRTEDRPRLSLSHDRPSSSSLSPRNSYIRPHIEPANMASLYNLEPQPTAKVILQTTAGDIALELFGKQAPLATRNFLQHCLDGYYNNTIFHRLVPGFIIQGGDPTGTGSGGISALNDGEAFEDEFHSRLKFNRRGLLGMANEGKDSNGSQFFITLGSTPELQGKHTMFGRIEGETIYNLMKMAEVEMTEEEGSERPMYPTKVTGSEILVNPFEGMEARVKEAPRTARDDKRGKDVKKRKKPLGKNVLSFGGDEGEEDAAPVVKKVKANPKLVATVVEGPKDSNDTPMPAAPEPKKKKVEKRQRSPSPVTQPPPEAQKPTVAAPAALHDESEDEDDQPQKTKSSSALERTNAEIAALKASMKRTVDTAPKEKEKPKSALEAMIPATSTRGRKRGKGADERGALDLFKAFKQKLEELPAAPEKNGENDHAATNGSDAPQAEPTKDELEDEEAALCDLHFIANCQSCRAWDDEKPDGEAEANGDDDPGWMAHQLTFARDTLGKDLEWKKKMSEIEVIDPREKAREIAEAKKGGKGKGKSKA